MSVGANRVFNVSDPHPVAFSTRDSNTDCPRYPILRMYLCLISERAFL